MGSVHVRKDCCFSPVGCWNYLLIYSRGLKQMEGCASFSLHRMFVHPSIPVGFLERCRYLESVRISFLDVTLKGQPKLTPDHKVFECRLLVAFSV